MHLCRVYVDYLRPRIVYVVLCIHVRFNLTCKRRTCDWMWLVFLAPPIRNLLSMSALTYRRDLAAPIFLFWPPPITVHFLSARCTTPFIFTGRNTPAYNAYRLGV